MTWKRVATSAVLIPFVVGIVLWGSTAVMALAVALVTLLALFEYFALGEAIGHRAYRFWTATCALLLIFVQWLLAGEAAYRLSGDLVAYRRVWWFGSSAPGLETVFFLFVLGTAVIALFTKRPLVETLPAAGISSSGLILVAFPLSYAVRLHGAGSQGPALLLFAMVIIWVGDTAVVRQIQAGVAFESEQDLGGSGCQFSRLADRGGRLCAIHERAVAAFAGHGGGRECRGTGRGPAGIGL